MRTQISSWWCGVWKRKYINIYISAPTTTATPPPRFILDVCIHNTHALTNVRPVKWIWNVSIALFLSLSLPFSQPVSILLLQLYNRNSLMVSLGDWGIPSLFSVFIKNIYQFHSLALILWVNSWLWLNGDLCPALIYVLRSLIQMYWSIDFTHSFMHLDNNY